MDDKSRSEQDLLQRLKRGDEHAWNYFYQEYNTRVYNYLYRKLPSPQDVEDAVQETLFGIVRSIATFDGSVTLTTFIFSLANNKVADFYRKHQITAELADTFVDTSSGMTSIEFQETLNSLKPIHREALIMRHQLKLTVDEIKEMLNLGTYKATESLLSRARQEFKQALDRDQEELEGKLSKQGKTNKHSKSTK
jgi:RNA polymerase sigma-70 factor (ECF subfamily)